MAPPGRVPGLMAGLLLVVPQQNSLASFMA
jgi:hypothetical protein